MNAIFRKPRWILIVILFITVTLLYLALRKVDWGELVEVVTNVRGEYLLLALLIGCLTILLRALRWRVILSSERALPLSSVFWAMMIGYLGNAFLPARAGELARSIALGRRTQISSSFVLATAFTERILDAAVLILIGSLSILSTQNISPVLLQAGQTMMIITCIGLLCIFLLPVFQNQITYLLMRLPIPPATLTKGLAMMDRFLFGMRSLRNPIRAISFFCFTIMIWLGDAISTVVVAHSLSLNLSISQAFLLIVALGLSSAVPSTPGYIGVYQFVAVSVLSPFGFSNSQAIAYILVFQVLNYILVSIWGLLGLWRMGLLGKIRDILVIQNQDTQD